MTEGDRVTNSYIRRNVNESLALKQATKLEANLQVRIIRSNKKQNRRRQEQRQEEAQQRQEAYNKLTYEQKLAKLYSYQAKRQRARLQKNEG